MPGPTNAQFEVALTFRDKATGKFVKASNDMRKAVHRQATETQKNHKRIEQSAKRMATSYSQGMKSMRLSTSGLREVVGRLRNQLLLIAFAYQLFQRVIKPMITLAIQQEFAERKLEAAFVGSGLATKKQVQNLKELANQLQSTTMFSNEVIINAQAMLATFKLNSEQVEQLTIRMLDMATAVTNVSGKEADLQAIAIALGKGVTGNIGILSRYGIVLSETAKKSGDFNLIMKELDKNFKGMAEAMRTTFMGQMKMSGNVVGDFQKELGFVITKSTMLIASFDLMRKSLIKSTENMKKARGETDNFAKGWENFIHGILVAVVVLKTFWAGFRQGIRVSLLAMGKALEVFMRATSKVFGVWKTELATIMEFNRLLIAELKEAPEDIKTLYEGLASQFTNLALTMQEFANMNTAIFDELTGNGEEAITALEKKFKTLKPALDVLGNSLHTFFYDVMIGEMKTVQDYWDSFTKALLKSWTKMLADMMVKAIFWEAVMATLSIFSSGASGAAVGAGKGLVTAIAHKGGFVEGGKVKRYQQGGVVPALLEPGEGVVSRRGMGALGRKGLDMLNRGQPSQRGTVINQYYINAMDVKTFRDYLSENQDIFVASVQGDLESNGSLRKIFKGGI